MPDINTCPPSPIELLALRRIATQRRNESQGLPPLRPSWPASPAASRAIFSQISTRDAAGSASTIINDSWQDSQTRVYMEEREERVQTLRVTLNIPPRPDVSPETSRPLGSPQAVSPLRPLPTESDPGGVATLDLFDDSDTLPENVFTAIRPDSPPVFPEGNPSLPIITRLLARDRHWAQRWDNLQLSPIVGSQLECNFQELPEDDCLQPLTHFIMDWEDIIREGAAATQAP